MCLTQVHFPIVVSVRPNTSQQGIKAPFQHLEESVQSGFWSMIKKLLKDLKKHACAKVSTF
jgi:hypothetical protein